MMHFGSAARPFAGLQGAQTRRPPSESERGLQRPGGGAHLPARGRFLKVLAGPDLGMTAT